MNNPASICKYSAYSQTLKVAIFSVPILENWHFQIQKLEASFCLYDLNWCEMRFWTNDSQMEKQTQEKIELENKEEAIFCSPQSQGSERRIWKLNHAGKDFFYKLTEKLEKAWRRLSPGIERSLFYQVALVSQKIIFNKIDIWKEKKTLIKFR